MVTTMVAMRTVANRRMEKCPVSVAALICAPRPRVCRVLSPMWKYSAMMEAFQAPPEAVIKPVMFVMTLPVTILTLGLFVLVIDAAMLGLVSLVVPHFHIHSLGSGIGLAIIVAITHMVAVSVFGKQKQHS